MKLSNRTNHARGHGNGFISRSVFMGKQSSINMKETAFFFEAAAAANSNSKLLRVLLEFCKGSIITSAGLRNVYGSP